ncbi:hypothetical protein [Streptomyces sp. NPDC053048]|uniref:hypothetical protein n=1 Tax=Streptomyces sp. NPDC053048 TaxID=3365694 RepID=UPI0037D4F9E2
MSDHEFPAIEQVLAAVRSFERIEFDVPDGMESDGFLFQYGEVNWFPDPTFTVGFVRQLELVDADGDHEGYSQVQIEYAYELDAELVSMGGGDSWCFRGDETPFDEWFEAVTRDPVWGAVRGKVPKGFHVSQEVA